MIRQVQIALCSFLLAAPYADAQVAQTYAGIDHVQLAVADTERALAFYTKLFGSEVWKDTQSERRFLPLGTSYLALDAAASARIDHVCLGLEPFSLDLAHAWLSAQNIVWQDAAEQGPDANTLHVDDRNGIRTQLAQHNGWERLSAGSAAREARAAPDAPIFEAYAIDEVFLTVQNLEVDSLFYSRLLDQTGTLQAGSLWFQVGATSRLRMTQAPVGQMPGVSYFAVHVAYTDMEAAAEAVFNAGGIIENILPNGFSFWDPDGIRVVVRSGDLF